MRLSCSSSSCAGAAVVLWLVVVVLLLHDHHHGVVSASASASAAAGQDEDSSSLADNNNRRDSDSEQEQGVGSSSSSMSSLRMQKKKQQQHRPYYLQKLATAAQLQHYLQQKSSSIIRIQQRQKKNQQQQQLKKKNHFQIGNYHLRNENKQQLIGHHRRRNLDEEEDDTCLSGTEPNFGDDDFDGTFFGGDDNNYGTVCTCIQGKDNQAEVFASIQAEPDVTNPEQFVTEFNAAISQLQVMDEYSCTNTCETCVTESTENNYCGILSTTYKYTISRITPGDFTTEDILNILSGATSDDIDLDDLLDEGNVKEEDLEEVCFDFTSGADQATSSGSSSGKVCYIHLDFKEGPDFTASACRITFNNEACTNCFERFISAEADDWCIFAECANHWDGANIDTCNTMTTAEEQGLIGPFRPLALIWDEDDTATAASATKGRCIPDIPCYTEPPTPAPIETGLCLSDEEVDFSDDDFANIIFAPDYEPMCTCTFESNVGTIIASIGEPDDPMNTTSVEAWVDTFNTALGQLQVSQEYNCQNDCETCFTVNTDAGGTTDLICGTFSTNHRTDSQSNEGNFTVFDIAQAFDEATIAELLEANSKFYEETCIDYTSGETGKVCFAFDIHGVFPEEGDAPCIITYDDDACASCILQRSPATTATEDQEECVIANCSNHLEGANINTCTGEGLIGPFMPIMYVTEELTPDDITMGGDCGEGPPFCLADDEVNFSDNEFAVIVFAPEYEPVCTCTSQDNTAEVIANVGEPSLEDFAAIQAWLDAFNQAIGQIEFLNEYDCLNECETCFKAGSICGIFSTNQRTYASSDEGNFTFANIDDVGEIIPNLLEGGTEFYDETCIDYTTGETGKVCFIYDIKGGFPDGDAPCQITYNDDSCTSCVRQVSTEECVVADCTNLLEGANINTCTGEGLSGPFMPIMYVTEELTPDEVTKGNCGFTPAPDTPAPITVAPVTPTPVAENTTAPTVAPVTPVPADTENTTAPTDAPVTPEPTDSPVSPAPTDSPVTPAPTDAPDTGAPKASKAAAVYQMPSIMVGAMILGCGFYIA